jgi:2'-phosphotransferase
MSWSRLKSLQVTFPDILTAVNDNAKNRFSMKPNPKFTTPINPDSVTPSDWVIRANQGHSIAIESASLLKPITLEAGNVPEIVVHGTYFAFYQSILDTRGLKKMARTHIHFGTGLPEDKEGVVSGMRKDAELLIYVDVKKSIEDGKLLWWVSDNGVVLTEGNEEGVLSTKYFQKVVGRNENECPVLWQDGEMVESLPDKLKGRKAPFGPKGGRGSRGKGDRGRGGGRGRGKSGRGRGDFDSSTTAQVTEKEPSASQP